MVVNLRSDPACVLLFRRKNNHVSLCGITLNGRQVSGKEMLEAINEFFISAST